MSTIVSDNFSTSDEDRFDLSHVLDTLLQYIWLIIGVFAVAILAGAIYLFFAEPIYRADALIQVEDKKSSMLSGVQEIADALGTGANPVTGEIEILRSREVIVGAIKSTKADIQVEIANRFPIVGDWYARRHLNDGPRSAPFGLDSYAWGGELLKLEEFSIPESHFGRKFIFKATESGYVVEDQDGVELTKGVVGKAIDFEVGGKPARVAVSGIKGRVGTEFDVIRVDPITAYKAILGKISVAESGRQSNIIRISYEDSDIDFAQAIVNAIAKAYLTQNVERRTAEADQSLKFLDEQLPEIKKNVERSEDALNAFRTRTSTISVEQSTQSLLGQAVEVERGRLQLELKKNELLQRFRPDHPEVKALDAQLAATKQESNKVDEMVNRLPAAQRDLLRLQRDVEVNNQLYIALLNNAQQLKIAKAGTIGNVRIIDFAVKDKDPVFPSGGVVMAIAGITGVVLGLFAAFLVRLLRPTLREADEIERGTGLVSYATVPESTFQEKLDSSKRDSKGKSAVVDGRTQLLALLQPDDPAVESLRSLRTGLAFALMGAKDKNIVITGATASLGKSFVSANLSLLLASAGKRVLLVETDMRRPQLGAYFGYGETVGLSDLLAGTTTIENVLRKEIVPNVNLTVLPAGRVPPNPGELLLSETFPRLMEKFQNDYDHIILDSAPVLPVGDTLAVARCAATTFLIVRAEQSTLGEVRDAMKRLQSAGASVKGFIFNGIKRRRVSYGAAYRYYYGYGEKK